MNYRILVLAAVAFAGADSATPDIVSSGSDHYILRHEASSELPPAVLWDRFVDVSAWWHPDHTYSGDADNLKLDPVAGGAWREDWQNGSVIHGEVLYASPPHIMRLEAPFGPLQGMAVNVVWSISIQPSDTGSLVMFDEIATGASASGLEQLAPAVDGVKQEALDRLVSDRPS
ncbi:MAG: hypothetical protein AAGJ84_00110 [Pseudomonadota bacterium]